MGWDNVGDDALKRVEKQAEKDGMADLFSDDIKGKLKREGVDPAELDKAEALMAAVKANTDKNARAKAIADFKNSVCEGTYELVATAATGAIKAMF